MTEPDQYVLGYRRAEQERLQQQAQQLAPESSWKRTPIPEALAWTTVAVAWSVASFGSRTST